MLPDNYHARIDAHPHRQPNRGGEATHTLDDTETGAHGPFSVILMCLRVTEVCHYPVAEILGDTTGVALYNSGTCMVEVLDHLVPVLGVKLTSESCRADHIGKQDGDVTPLGMS